MPSIIRFARYFKILLLFFFKTQVILAQNGSSAQEFQVPLTEDGISTRLEPEKNENITFPKTAFLFGAYQEMLFNQSDSSYAPTGLGLVLGFEQNISSIWSGGLELRWSDWNPRLNPNSAAIVNKVSPLSLFSKVSVAPKLGFLLGSPLGDFFRPYLTGGIGYTSFFNERSWLSARSQTAFGQASLTYGGGVRFVLSPSIGIKLGYENWRGLETSEYAAQLFLIQLIFGDVIHL